MVARSTTGSPEPGLAQVVAEHVRDSIYDGSLLPGTRLVERQLAARFGTSHIPVREALAQLAEEGLVERAPRRGARVAALDPRSLEELESLRCALEQLVVRRAQERWSEPAERELRRIAREMLRAADRADVAELNRLDEGFHERLWHLADHRLLLEVVAGLRGRIRCFLLAAIEALPREDLRAHAEAHASLVDVIASGDAAAAERAMARHIDQAARRIGAAADGAGTPPAPQRQGRSVSRPARAPAGGPTAPRPRPR